MAESTRRRVPAQVADLITAVVLTAFEIWALWWLPSEGIGGAARWPAAAGVLIAVVLTLPVALRRRAPVAVLAATGAGYVAAVLNQQPFHGLGPMLALYTVAAHRPPRIAVPVLVAALAGLAALMLGLGDPLELDVLLLAAAAGGLGAVQRRTVLLEEREREGRARLAVAEERAAIARELHDVLTSGIGAMVVQTGAARLTLRQDPDRAERVLTGVEALGRQSIAELRAFLRLLRAGDSGPELTPQPGLDRVEGLVDGFRAAGLPVELTVTGRRRPLAPRVDLSGYRIVQEALTNVVKHAGPVPTAVAVVYGEDALHLSVSDQGPGGPVGEGHGLVGMRERAALVGGRVEAGARDGGGFTVTATLPAPS